MAEKKIVRAGTGEEVKKTVKNAADEAEKTVKKAKTKAAEAAEEVEETVEEAVEEVEEEVEEAVEEAPKKVKKAVKKAVEDDDEEEEEKAPAKKKAAAPVGDAKKLRIGAVCLWVVALCFELVAIFFYAGKLTILPGIGTLTKIIIALVLDLACVIAGSQLWKKANHIDPVSKKNKVKFWLWNNMGVIVCAFCFIPFIILALSDKNADPKTKRIAIIAAVVALLIGGAASYDWNPASAEDKQAAMQEITGDVYWSPYGHVYHTSEECQALNHSDTLTVGDVEQAIAAGRTRLCSFCARRDNISEAVYTDAD